MANILLVEDNAETQELLLETLEKLGQGFHVKAVSTGRRALDYLSRHDVACVLLDFNLPDGNGLRLFHKIRELQPALPAIFVTVESDTRKVVEAIKLGAVHYVVKNDNYLPELLHRVREALGTRDLQRGLAGNRFTEPPKREVCERFRLGGLIGNSPSIHAAISAAEKAAGSRAAVLLQGETGTGKELFARAIHDHGTRSTGPFITVNCPAIPKDLLESELFGHVKGAFTGATENRRGSFELADTGTIFLDEVGELDNGVQAKLLRVLEDCEVHPVGSETTRRVLVRIIAATNRDLRYACEQEIFRQDLYFRLSALRILLPPLRERPTDIVPLFRHFLQRFGEEEGRLAGRLAPDAAQLLERYPWPGNVRELRNEAHSIVACIDAGQLITAEVLSAEIRGAETIDDEGTLKEINGRVDAVTIQSRLRKYAYNVPATARSLGITREWLWEKMRQLGIKPPDR